ncbi:asparagine synthase (glutamine-hydrolyzing) [Candidatus Woesearchaeota archaeon]|nr:asparagine synthase (glutamine-hydrolyzing) [Candidatus Woesearchaeota archaeon]
MQKSLFLDFTRRINKMCGIVGFNARKDSKKIVQSMLRTLKSRGPNQKGTYSDKKITLGHTRLSIIDLKSGKQPIHNEDNTIWIVYNGECYNFNELKKELSDKGHKFYTATDTEVLLHLYEEYGEDFLKKVDGMFSLCIYDKKKKSILLARDRFGKKPLYYSNIGGSFVFASELKTLLIHPDIKKQLNKGALKELFFYGFIPSPKTIFKNIEKLEAGCYLKLKGSKIDKKRYWNPELGYKNIKNFKKNVDDTESLLKKAVEKRLISDVPLGVFLSGGIDSSLVVSYMKDLLGAKRVKAFSIGFSEEKFDESKYAEKVAKHLGVNHEVKIFSEKDSLEAVKKAYSYLSEPMSDPSIIPTYLLSKFTKNKVTVALSGDGGDELFLGYPKYLASRFLDKGIFKSRLSKCFINFAVKSLFAKNNSKKLKDFAKGLKFPSSIRNQVWISPFSPEELGILFDSKCSVFNPIQYHHSRFKGGNAVDESSYLDIKLTLQDLYLLKVDRASMANSLEVRSPFLDKDLAEFVFTIPYNQKLKRNKLKAILKKIAEKRIPKEVIYRKKMGFGIPVSKWIKGKLKKDIIMQLSPAKLRKQKIFNSKQVSRIIMDHLNGKEDNSMKIWALYTFQLWYSRWMNDEKSKK